MYCRVLLHQLYLFKKKGVQQPSVCSCCYNWSHQNFVSTLCPKKDQTDLAQVYNNAQIYTINSYWCFIQLIPLLLFLSFYFIYFFFHLSFLCYTSLKSPFMFQK